MTEEKNNNSFLSNTKALILILIAIAGIVWGASATVNTTKSQVIDLRAAQETFVSKELFNAHLQLWDKRFQIMETQLTRIERLLVEQKK